MTNDPIFQDLLLLAAMLAAAAVPLCSGLFRYGVNRRNEDLRLMLRNEASSPWHFFE